MSINFTHDEWQEMFRKAFNPTPAEKMDSLHQEALLENADWDKYHTVLAELLAKGRDMEYARDIAFGETYGWD